MFQKKKNQFFYWQYEIHIEKCYPYMFIIKHFISLLKYFFPRSGLNQSPNPLTTFQTAN